MNTHRTTILMLAITAALVSGCARNVETSKEGAPNLVEWTQSIKDRAPDHRREPLPLLSDQQVFSYKQHSVVRTNINPEAALARAEQQPPQSIQEISNTSPSIPDADGPDSTVATNSEANPDASQDASDEVAEQSATEPSSDANVASTETETETENAPEVANQDGVQKPEVSITPITATLRSPFDFPMARTRPGSPRPDESRVKQPLESFPLDALSMVGTLGSGASLVALIQSPDRVVYRVRAGQYLGQQNGRIVRIEDTGVDVSEIVADGMGGWTEQSASLILKE